MKITKKQLKQIIKEELEKVIAENVEVTERGCREARQAIDAQSNPMSYMGEAEVFQKEYGDWPLHYYKKCPSEYK